MTFIERTATIPFLTHPDYEKCGQCWREFITFQTAVEYKIAGKTSDKYLKEMYAEIERKWEETPLFKEVSAMLAEGKRLDEIGKYFAAKGVEI